MDICEQYKQKRLEIEKAQKELKELEENLPVHKLAIFLHECFCTYNHTDGCGFYYEIAKNVHDWNGYSHKSWKEKAIKLIGFLGSIEMEQLEKVCKSLKDSRIL